MKPNNKSIATNFIEEIWNKNSFEKIDLYLSPDFTDHSLPPQLPPDKEGTLHWIKATGHAFEHKTLIDDIVTKNNKVMMKIRMQLKHIGVWRNIEPTHLDVSTTGYRFFRLFNGKIIEQWSLLDGNTIENQLKESHHGCKIQV